MTKVLKPVMEQALMALTPAKAKELFLKMSGSVDTRRNTLAETKTFFRRAKVNGWIDTELLNDVNGEGKRRRGKAKLTKDEARRYLDKCRELSQDKKRMEIAVAAAMPLLLGYRASEVVERQVRDLDDGGTVLRVPRAKSQAGIRSQQLPDWFQPLLARLVAGKLPTDRIFDHDRGWLLRQVKRMCKLANVPLVSAHGLRGTHADLSLHVHVTALAVSQALGHTSTNVTFAHYADRTILEDQQHARAVSLLTREHQNQN